MRLWILTWMFVAACGHHADGTPPAPGAPAPAPAPAPASGMRASRLTVTSPAFADHGELPAKYTCEGANVSPPLAWSGAPAGTRQFAVIVDDPDAPDPAAPQRTWVHWVVPALGAQVTSLPEGASPPAGKNDFCDAKYGGPCPPIGRHRYFFKLYALDAALPATAGETKAELLKAIAGHVLAEGELVGTYQKKK